MNQNNRGFTTCENPHAAKDKKAEWDRMVRDLETREQEGQDAKHRKRNT